MSFTENTEIISAVVSEVAASLEAVFDVSVEIVSIKEEFNLFQLTIMEFIYSVFTDLTIEQELSISLAILNFDFRSIKVNFQLCLYNFPNDFFIQVNEFSAVFSSISFSSDADFNSEISTLVDSAEFVSIDLVMNIFTVFIESGVKIETLNEFDLTSVVTTEFWSTTEVTAELVVQLIEATSVETEIITVVMQSGQASI